MKRTVKANYLLASLFLINSLLQRYVYRAYPINMSETGRNIIAKTCDLPDFKGKKGR